MMVEMRKRTPMQRFVMAAAIPFLLACHDAPNVTPPNTAGTSRAYLTGAAADALDPEGYFRLQSSSGWKRTELTEAQAEQFAEVYIRKFAPTLPSYFERSHGAKINFAALNRCGRAFYGVSPYEEPLAGVDEGTLNGVASQWLFSYCGDDGLPIVSVAIAATATHLRIEDGSFARSSLRGNEILGSGIPRGTELPMSPERAVEMLAGAAGRRISQVPRLVLPGIPYYPQSARWELVVETAASIRTARGDVSAVSRFFVGRALKEWNTEIAHGVAQSDDAPTDAIVLASGQRLEFARVSGMPRAWERIEFIGGRP